jgi:hypothetical protein
MGSAPPASTAGARHSSSFPFPPSSLSHSGRRRAVRQATTTCCCAPCSSRPGASSSSRTPRALRGPDPPAQPGSVSGARRRAARDQVGCTHGPSGARRQPRFGGRATAGPAWDRLPVPAGRQRADGLPFHRSAASQPTYTRAGCYPRAGSQAEEALRGAGGGGGGGGRQASTTRTGSWRSGAAGRRRPASCRR